MPLDSPARLMALFGVAVELPADQREALLLRECAGAPALLAELRELLAADERLGGTTVQPLARGLMSLVAASAPDASLSGMRVGPYELREELGRGGMGLVYRAERVDGVVQQQVAIKFVRHELLDAETRRRFLVERQTLAALDHPNIARLYDAAELEDGSPYYVMEYVAGTPIDEHCEQAQLSVSKRVALFRTICGAAAEAHRNLIVHRDLKPGNILVSVTGVPKLLDFGIAKPLSPGNDALAQAQTGTAQRYFSPLYAAPEQLLGGTIGVGCDVYALGLLMYEVLTGTRPFDFNGLSAGQIERLIATVPPTAPSASAARTGTPAVNVRQLRGDLDGIVLRCLRKAPAERYASVEQLEADLDNYLEGRPVHARGGHGWYRLRKFVGRHRLSVAIATNAALALASAATLLFTQNVALTHERDRAQHALDFLKGAFIAADPAQVAGADVTARQILDAQRTRLDELFETQPELYASLATTIAEVQLAMGMAQQANELSGRAVDAARRAGLDPVALQHLMTLQVQALATERKFPDADAKLVEAAGLGVAPTAELQVAQARVLEGQGKTAPAIALFEQVIQSMKDRPPSEDLPTFARWQLAETLRRKTRFEEALAILDQTLAWQRRELSEGHPRIVQTRMFRVDLLRRLGRREEALTAARSVVGEVEAQYGADTSVAATARGSFGSVLMNLGHYPEAIAELRAALQAWNRTLGREHPSTLRTAFNLASALAMLPAGSAEAEAIFRDVLEAANHRYGTKTQLVVYFRLTMGRFLLDRDRAAEALTVLAGVKGIEGLRIVKEPNRTDYLSVLGKAYKASGCATEDKSAMADDTRSACVNASAWIEPLSPTAAN